MTRTSWILGTLAFTLTAPLVGCGGIEPGDYVVYRVATSSGKLSGDCANNDLDTKSDSTTLLGPGTWVLYAGLEETFYLDVGGSTLEGTAADDVYTFAGKQTDIEYSLPNGGGDKTTSTKTTSVEVTIDGAAVTGTYADKLALKCVGAGCGGLVDYTCTTTQSFVGTEVEDVELDYGL
jgi:hypothetical protein